MLDCDKIVCERCGESKSVNDFWFNKTRGKIDKPCKSCRNAQKRLKRKVDYTNGYFIKSEVDKSYRLRGYPDSVKEIILNNLRFQREVSKMENPLVFMVEDKAMLICPRCAFSSSINIPATPDEFVTLFEFFKNTHSGKNCQKQKTIL